jgi:hypothetical protein
MKRCVDGTDNSEGQLPQSLTVGDEYHYRV